MAYITVAQLTTRFGEGDMKAWTDDDASGSIDETIAAAIIANVEALIDQAAAQHYTTPLTLTNVTTAAVVRDMALSLAGYRLATRRPQGSVSDDLLKLYDDALKWLQNVREGKVLLTGEAMITASKPSGGIVIAGDTALIDRDKMEGW